MDSLRTFNIWNDIDDELVKPQRSLEIIDMHPLPDAWKERVRHATPMSTGKNLVIMGQTFARAQFSPYPRKWCPGCIAESAYHRVWWDIIAIRRCPVHDMTFQTRDDLGNPVNWGWTDFENSRQGRPLGSTSARRVMRRSFALYALGRMGCVKPTPNAILDGLHLRDAIDVCEVLGKFLRNPHSPFVPDIEDGDIDHGYALVVAGIPAVTDAIRDWLRKNCPADLKSTSILAAFGWIARRIPALRDRGLQKLLRRILKDARGFEGARFTHVMTVDNPSGEYLTIRAVAERLGMRSRGVIQIADELAVINRARLRELVPASATRRIEAFTNALLAPKETARRLGVHPDALRHLTRAGLLKVFVGTVTGQRIGARYDPGRVQSILDKIDALPTNGQVEYGITFDIYRKRNKMVPGALALDVLEGRIPIAEKRGDVEGFKRVVIQSDDFRRGRPFGRPEGWVNVAQAQAITNLSFVSVSALVEQGLLGEVDRKPFLVLLRRDAVVDFAAKHAKISDFAPGLGMHPTLVFRRLKEAGVELVLAGNHKGRRTESVVRRNDVLRVFGLAEDPSVIAEPRFDALWRRVLASAELVKAGIDLPQRLPAAGQRAWQGSGMLSAVFAYDAADEVLRVTIKPYGSDRRSTVIRLDEPDEAILEFFREVAADVDQSLAYNNERKRRVAAGELVAKKRSVPNATDPEARSINF
ncbi:MAG: TniQ family protein [Rhizobium sp.]|nr:TniQ family protein [Rhizobium sp.]